MSSVGHDSSDRSYRGKRVVDLAVLAIVGVPAFVVGSVCAVAIRVLAPGPVFFRQERVGLAGQRFSVWKFRTMTVGDNPIYPDATRITQIIWNLLRNSIKFTPPGGTITIRSRIISEGEDAGVLIEVQDTGMGIDPDSLDKIFDAFQQGSHGITHQFGGLGLGLAISKAIAESHQGRLAAVSEGAGRGCTFRLTLPFVESRNAESGTWGLGGDGRVETGLLEKPNWSERPARILLVEDHADSALVLSRLLRKTGHHVVHASSIAEALQLAESEMAAFGIDLVISDLGLPDGSGFSLMEDLSAKYGLRGIALSGYGMDADLEQSKAAGFTHHLVKPVDINDVRCTIFMMMKPS